MTRVPGTSTFKTRDCLAWHLYDSGEVSEDFDIDGGKVGVDEEVEFVLGAFGVVGIVIIFGVRVVVGDGGLEAGVVVGVGGWLVVLAFGLDLVECWLAQVWPRWPLTMAADLLWRVFADLRGG